MTVRYAGDFPSHRGIVVPVRLIQKPNGAVAFALPDVLPPSFSLPSLFNIRVRSPNPKAVQTFPVAQDAHNIGGC